MSFATSRSIFISYVEDDKAVATKLHEILTEFLGDQTWLRDFDLDGGDLIVEAIDIAIAEANWFIILVSASAMEGKWLKTEANLATIRGIEDLNFKIIVVRLDKSELPRHLEIALKTQYTVDLTEVDDREAEFIRIADYIDKTASTRSRKEVYVDRGEDSDRFSLLARRNRIVFILGWAGIGKSAFVTHSVAEKLHKRTLIVKLTPGHSVDLLARQILRKAHVPQPISTDRTTDQQLISAAIEALKERADRFFLFVDDAEEGLDASNQLLPYLEDFLERFIKADIDTHVILATTRNPDYSASISNSADLLRLEGLADAYVRENIDLWLEGTEKHSQLMNMPEMADLVALVAGHPLAAKMMASYLKVKTPQQLLLSKERKRFQLKFAQYILRSADLTILTDLHRLMLQVLATVREPMLLEDMLAVRELNNYSLEDIHKARWELSDWFLVEQDGEMMSLHSFLGAYYRDQLSLEETRRDGIASDFGHYAYHRTMGFNEELSQILKEDITRDDDIVVRISSDIFRYAIPAGRLLRSVGEDELADKLPIQIKGTLREMVFYFYQDRRDYKKACTYAENWLKVNPQDREIMLYHARCHRNFREPQSLLKAKEIISRLETKDYKKRFAARICREKALIAEFSGDSEKAKDFFREGIKVYTPYPYPENYVGLAQLLLREIDELPYGWEKKQALADEAVELLETAREQSAIFDRFHLGTYVEALIQAGREETAFPLLQEALEDRPLDERLNYRMAEILRKRGQYDEAEIYAVKAHKRRASKAPLTLANIKHGQAEEWIARGRDDIAQEKLNHALLILLEFRPEFGHDQEVADGIKSKIYRTMGDWAKALTAVAKYPNTDNPYTIYEQCRIDLWESEIAQADERYAAALGAVRRAIDRIRRYQIKHDLSRPLQDILLNAETKEGQLELIVND